MKSPTILYSLNGEGRYTSGEIRELMGKPKMSVTEYVVNGKGGIKEVAHKRYRIVRKGKVLFTGTTIADLSQKAGVSWQSVQSHKSHPERYATRKYVVEEYWENL